MTRIRLSLGILLVSALIVGGCSQDPTTDQLSIQYSSAGVSLEKRDGKTYASVNAMVKLINRTEQAMSVAFLEGTVIDASTKLALLRFRHIIPQSYGTISSAQLVPKQVKEVQVIAPPELDGFDAGKSPSVIVKIAFQTTKGYRTEVATGPISVAVK